MGLFCDVAMVVTSQVNGAEKNMAKAKRGDIFSGKKSGIVSREVIEILLKEVIMSFFFIVRQF